ncbi:MAG: hypothetical protein ACFB9M_12590 [Myxococcota bacterium]
MKRTVLYLIFLLLCCGTTDPEPIPRGQVARRETLVSMGVTLDDAERRISDRELDRILHIVHRFDEVGLIRPFLERIEIRRGNPSFEFGTRPMALLGQRTVVFFTWEHATAPEAGALYSSLDHLVSYFTHELGHLIGASLPREARMRFEELHARSEPGFIRSRTPDHADPTRGIGDFPTAYANTNVEEDLAECVSFAILGPHPWNWRQNIGMAFDRHPILAEKLDIVMRFIAAHRGGSLPVMMTGSDSERATEPSGLPYELQPAFVSGPEPWSVPADFAGISSQETFDALCDADGCRLERPFGTDQHMAGTCVGSLCPDPLHDIMLEANLDFGT